LKPVFVVGLQTWIGFGRSVQLKAVWFGNQRGEVGTEVGAGRGSAVGAGRGIDEGAGKGSADGAGRGSAVGTNVSVGGAVSSGQEQSCKPFPGQMLISQSLAQAVVFGA
jgi:hypothetical protein